MRYSKGGEDEWLLLQFPEDYRGYAVELGAADGTFISCTKLLEERGWTCLCIEPNPRHQEALRRDRKLVLTCACDSAPEVRRKMYEYPNIEGNTWTGTDNREGSKEFEVTVLTLEQCLAVANFPRLDVLVLDVDGLERRIIDGFDIDRWKPKAVIIEGDKDGRLDPFLSRGYRQIYQGIDDNRYMVAP